MGSMNRLSTQDRAQILGMMVEGVSIRAIARLTGASKNTIVKLLVDAGQACSEYQDRTLRDLKSKRLQLDEIWSFIGMKERNVPDSRKGMGVGDIWTWTAIDADSKLIASWMVGDRSGDTARVFVCDLAKRLANRVQITTDGHRAYMEAVEAGFGAAVDYAMLVKIYGQTAEGQRRYSPPQIIGTETECCTGNPDPKHISTSFAERSNLSIRMGLRRFTRLTNAFSKKVENHVHALSIYFMHYNFCRIHQTLRTSPAQAAGVTSKLWELTDIVRMVDEWEAKQKVNDAVQSN
jgi:IS1 family transposase